MPWVLLVMLGASWPQKRLAVEKQARLLQSHGRSIGVVVDTNIDAGRPIRLASLRSEVESLERTVNRLEAKVRDLRAD